MISEFQIPQGWQWINLADAIISITTGTTPPSKVQKYYGGDIQWFTPGDIGEKKFLVKSARTLTDAAVLERKARIFEPGTLLITCIGNIGRVGILREHASANQQITGIMVDESVLERDFVFWWFHAIKSQLQASAPGGVITILNQTNLKKVPVPLPFPDEPKRSLKVQQRIVARIEALLAEVREMRKLQGEITADADELMSAILAETFPAIDQSMLKGWVLKKVKDIADKPQYGLTQSAKSYPIGPKFLRITDIQNGNVNWDNVPYCDCDHRCLEKYQLKTGDIVFARSGATTGKTYLIKDPPEEAVFASYLIRLVLHEQLPEYIYWFFQSPAYWRQIVPVGAAIPNMNATLLQEIKVPLPMDETEQRRIVSHLDLVKAEMDETRLLNEANQKYLVQLEQAILAQAFRGEL